MNIKTLFNNLNLMGKILVGFFTIGITTTILVGYFGLGGLSKFIDSTEKMSNERLPAIQSILSMKLAIEQIKSSQRTLLLPSISAEEKNNQYLIIEQALNDLAKNQEIYNNIPKTEKEKKLWEDSKEQFQILCTKNNTFLEICKKSTNTLIAKDAISSYNKINSVNDDLFTTFSKIESINNELLKLNNNLSEECKENTITLLTNTKISIIIVTLIGLIFAISFGIFISRNIVNKPFTILIQTFEKVINGDLRTHVPVKSNDEIGIISNYLNKLIDSQKKQLDRVLQNTKRVINSSNNLLEISKQSTDASVSLLNQSSSAASSSEQISSNLNMVSSASEEVATSISEIASSTSIASKLTSEANQKANKANEVMTLLDISSKEIGNIIKVITDISEQTNLLALNATIEAARAGEMGKGFAVVANEVKELAKETTKATENITNIINNIQTQTTNAIDVISEIISNTKQVSEITYSIAESVEEHTSTTMQINRNLSEASKGANIIAKANSEIAKNADEYASIASRVKVAADDLRKSALELESGLKQEFKF